jgi:HSP20 family protein
MRFYHQLPQRRISELRREMDRMLADVSRPRAAAYPPVNIAADEDGLVVTAELPGVDPAALEISAVRDQLTIRGELPGYEEEEGRTWHRRERRTGSFSRTIQLPYAIDADSVGAACRDGVLRITMKRPEVDKPRRIEVQIG